MPGPFDDLPDAVAAPQSGGAPQGSSAPQAYPAQGDYQPNPAQSALAWQLYKTGGIKPGGQAGTLNQPMFSVPGRPAPAGSYIIDQGGKLRVAGENDDGSPQPTGGSPFDDLPARNGVGADVLHSIGPGLAQGGAGLAGLWGDLQNLEGNGVQQGGTWLLNQLGARTPDGKPLSVPGYENFAHENNVATSADANQEIQQLAGPYYRPETNAGRYAQTIASFAPAAFGGEGSLLTRGAQVVLPAVGSQALGDLAVNTGHPKLEALARMAGATAGGLPVFMATAPSGAQRALASAAGNMTDSDLAATAALRQQGQDMGVPLTLAEGASKATNGSVPQLQRLQQRVEATPQGQAALAPFMTERPGAVARATGDFIDRVAPPITDPSMLGVNAQRAASGGIGDLEAQRTAAASPHYTAAAPVNVDAGQMGDLLSSIKQQIAGDKTGVLAKPLSGALSMLTDDAATNAAKASTAGPTSVRDAVEQAWAEHTGQAVGNAAAPAGPVPITDIGNLDRARKFIRDDTASRLANGSLSPEQGAALHGIASRLDDIMTEASPDFAQGKAVHATLSDNSVTPAVAGPAGAISRTSNLATQTGAIYPKAPFPGTAGETASALDLLNGQDPSLGGSLTRAYLERQAAGAMKDTPSGPNLYGGSHFINSVAGNPLQLENLRTGLNSVDPSLSSDFGSLSDVLSATGHRLPATPADTEALVQALAAGKSDPLEGAIGAGVGAEAFGHGGFALPLVAKGVGAVTGALQRGRIASNAQALADALTVAPEHTATAINSATDAVRTHPAMWRQIIGNILLAPTTGAPPATAPATATP